jgi:hypothetical protein
MKTYLLNALWLIMVSLLANNATSQITLDPGNLVETTIMCDELADIPVPTYKTNCEGEATITFEDKTYSGGCLGTIERIWLIRDNCNNSASFQQFIHLQDNKAPSLSAYPESVSVSFDNIPEVPVIIAKDNCSKNVKVVFTEEEFMDKKGDLDYINRKWYAEDSCGNRNSHTQTIVIKKS